MGKKVTSKSVAQKFELKWSFGGPLSKLCVTPPFSINFRCQIKNQVSDYRLLWASSLFYQSHYIVSRAVVGYQQKGTKFIFFSMNWFNLIVTQDLGSVTVDLLYPCYQVMAFELNLIAVILVQEEDLGYLFWHNHDNWLYDVFVVLQDDLEALRMLALASMKNVSKRSCFLYYLSFLHSHKLQIIFFNSNWIYKRMWHSYCCIFEK